jgi:transposase
MNKTIVVAPLSGIHVKEVVQTGAGWEVAATGPGCGTCQSCGVASSSRHSTYRRTLQDLPAQGSPVTMAVSDDTVIRNLKRSSRQRDAGALRVVGIDDWSWRKGFRFGTIMVDLERRTAVDVLDDRSSSSVAAWLSARPSIEVISRDRQGLYAEGARIGAPQARQVTDRFHLVQNLREMIEKQLGRLERPLRARHSVAVEHEDTRSGLHRLRQARFEQVRLLYDAGKTATAIRQELGLSRKRVEKWIRQETLPERSSMAPTPRSPAYYQGHLSRRWAEGCTVVRRLFTEIQGPGFTGSYTHLSQFVASWRRQSEAAPKEVTSKSTGLLARDPATGRQISPQIAAILCIKPRTQLTPRQGTAVDALKTSSSDFSTMRAFAMRFRGILQGRDGAKLDPWLDQAYHSGIYALQRFARTLQGDLDAIRNAVTEPWSSGQTEGQISRLKTMKRAMCGRAGIRLLCARMLPLTNDL